MEIENLGASLIQGDLSDPSSLQLAMDDVYGDFVKPRCVLQATVDQMIEK